MVNNRKGVLMGKTLSSVLFVLLLLLGGNRVTAQNPVCDICNGLKIGLPNSLVQDPYSSDRVPCYEMQFRGFQMLYDSVQCKLLQFSVATVCGCFEEGSEPVVDVPATTPAPVVAPTPAPAAPTPAPVMATSPPTTPTAVVMNPVCPICGDLMIGAPNNEVQDPVSGDRVTCAQLQVEGVEGLFNSLQCSIIQATVGTACFCTDGSVATTPPVVETAAPTTPAPVVVDTLAPTPPPTMAESVVVVTPAPATPEPVVETSPPATDAPMIETDAPVVATDAPGSEGEVTEPGQEMTPAPTERLPTVTGRLALSLESVAGPMPRSTAETFEVQTTLFFRDSLVGYIPPVRVTLTEIITQQFLPARRQLTQYMQQQQQLRGGHGISDGGDHRNLQSNLEFRPLLVILRITGQQQPPDSASFSKLLENTINENEELYISYLRNATPPINQVYFKSIDQVTADSENVLPSGGESSAPPDMGSQPPEGTGTEGTTTDEGLSAGKKAGISIAVIVGAILICVGSQVAYRKYREEKGASMSGDVSEESGSAGASAAVKAGAAAGAGAIVEKAEAPPEQSKKFTRKVIAPAGKLGIVIDTSVKGPIVKQVRPGSVLENLLFVGDIITAIDEVDARAMDSAAVNTIMSQRANQQKTLTVKSSVDAKPVTADSNGAAAAAQAPKSSIRASASSQRPAEAQGSSSSQQLPAITGPTRKVEVPPGKLGIVIDTSVKGPIVKMITPGSPLKNKLQIGDVIIGIDEVDARALDSAAVNKLMGERFNQAKTLTVVSPNGKAITPDAPVQSSARPNASSQQPPNNNIPPVVTMTREPEKPVAPAAAAATTATATAAAVAAASSTETPERGIHTKKVIAPSGKLGIVIDTTANGPVVHEIRPDSPLKSALIPGDVIVAIDDVDTMTMSAASITAFMIKTMDRQRILTVKSKIPGSPENGSSSVSSTPAPAPAAPPSPITKKAPPPPQPIAAPAPAPPPAPAVAPRLETEEETGEYMREVVAPPGKLAIVIDTSLEGPVVNQVLPTSPLVGKVYPGDTILAINGTNTEGMTGQEITSIMVKTVNENRNLTIKSSRPA